MRNSLVSFLTLFVFALCAALLPACKKSSQAPDTTVSVTVNVDGSALVWSNIKTTQKKGLYGKRYIQITADATDTSYMGLELYVYDIGPKGTIDLTKGYFGDFDFGTQTGLWEAGSYNDGSTGTIIITKNDTTARRVEGTFSGVAENDDQNTADTKTITNGVFKLSY